MPTFADDEREEDAKLPSEEDDDEDTPLSDDDGEGKETWE